MKLKKIFQIMVIMLVLMISITPGIYARNEFKPEIEIPNTAITEMIEVEGELYYTGNREDQAIVGKLINNRPTEIFRFTHSNASFGIDMLYDQGYLYLLSQVFGADSLDIPGYQPKNPGKNDGLAQSTITKFALQNNVIIPVSRTYIEFTNLPDQYAVGHEFSSNNGVITVVGVTDEHNISSGPIRDHYNQRNQDKKQLDATTFSKGGIISYPNDLMTSPSRITIEDDRYCTVISTDGSFYLCSYQPLYAPSTEVTIEVREADSGRLLNHFDLTYFNNSDLYDMRGYGVERLSNGRILTGIQTWSWSQYQGDSHLIEFDVSGVSTKSSSSDWFFKFQNLNNQFITSTMGFDSHNAIGWVDLANENDQYIDRFNFHYSNETMYIPKAFVYSDSLKCLGLTANEDNPHSQIICH